MQCVCEDMRYWMPGISSSKSANKVSGWRQQQCTQACYTVSMLHHHAAYLYNYSHYCCNSCMAEVMSRGRLFI